MKPTELPTRPPPKNSGDKSRLWPAAATYVASALAGALVGHECYQPTPPALDDRIVLSDLRHVGALAGALIGGMLTAVLARRLRDLRFKLLPQAIFLIASAVLAYLLCALNVLLGIVTATLLALPWLIAGSISGIPSWLRRLGIWRGPRQ